MIYTPSPKIIALTGPPAAGKTTAAEFLRDNYGYSLLGLDGINSTIAERLGLEIADLGEPRPDVVKQYKHMILEHVRALRFNNIVLEGCRVSYPHVYSAFVNALFSAYGDYFILKCYYLNPDRETRIKQYVLRQATLAKRVTKYGDKLALEALKHEYSKGFSEYLDPVLPDFEVVNSAKHIYRAAAAMKNMVHPSFPQEHEGLIKEIAEAGAVNAFYQRVDVDGKTIIRGFTDSRRSWDNILEFNFDFTGKAVLDIGCMLGYYSFKVEEAGGTAHGVDIDPGAIKGAQAVARARKSKNTFSVFDVTNPLDTFYDLILALNVLHRVADFEQVCRNIFQASDEFILEVGEVQIKPLVAIAEEYGLRMKKAVKSHRCSDVVGQRVLVHLFRTKAAS